MVNQIDSMEEAVSMMQNEMGGLRGEVASLKEYLQQALKVQQEMTRSGAPTGKELNPLELSATPNSSPMAESSTVQVMMRPEYKYRN